MRMSILFLSVILNATTLIPMLDPGTVSEHVKLFEEATHMCRDMNAKDILEGMRDMIKITQEAPQIGGTLKGWGSAAWGFGAAATAAVWKWTKGGAEVYADTVKSGALTKDIVNASVGVIKAVTPPSVDPDAYVENPNFSPRTQARERAKHTYHKAHKQLNELSLNNMRMLAESEARTNSGTFFQDMYCERLQKELTTPGYVKPAASIVHCQMLPNGGVNINPPIMLQRPVSPPLGDQQDR